MFKLWSSSCRTVGKLQFSSMIDEKELKVFQKLGDTWWKNAELHALQSMNKLRVPFIRDGLINTHRALPEAVGTHKPLKGLRILDVGCGGGYLSEPLARLGADTVGIDGAPEVIEAANMHKESELETNLQYEHTSVEEFALKNANQFDAVVASEVLDHVSNKSDFIKHCVECLKPGGSIYFTTINKTFLANIAVVYIAEILKLLPSGTHQFEKFVSPHEIRRLLEENDCSTRRIHGLFYNPLTQNWSWISSTDVNYAIHAVKNLES